MSASQKTVLLIWRWTCRRCFFSSTQLKALYLLQLSTLTNGDCLVVKWVDTRQKKLCVYIYILLRHLKFMRKRKGIFQDLCTVFSKMSGNYNLNQFNEKSRSSSVLFCFSKIGTLFSCCYSKHVWNENHTCLFVPTNLLYHEVGVG